MDAFLSAWTGGGSGVAITPGGLAYAGGEGQLRNAANAALLALAYARGRHDYRGVQLACWARWQVRACTNPSCFWQRHSPHLQSKQQGFEYGTPAEVGPEQADLPRIPRIVASCICRGGAGECALLQSGSIRARDLPWSVLGCL